MNEKNREAIIAALRAKHAAYVAIFGPADALKPEALTVLDDLDVFCKTWEESIHMDSQGRMDPYTTIYRDGKKAVPLRIRKMLEWSEPHDDSDPDIDGR